MMNNFEDQLDKIRLELYEETKDMAKQDAIEHVRECADVIGRQSFMQTDRGVTWDRQADRSNRPQC
jgi:hypothetical protein